jgi:hypothetical protein
VGLFAASVVTLDFLAERKKRRNQKKQRRH